MPTNCENCDRTLLPEQGEERLCGYCDEAERVANLEPFDLDWSALDNE